MTLNLSIYVITIKILLVACAPKLRYVLFEPLTYEAKVGPFSARRVSYVEESSTSTTTDHDTANLIQSDTSEEFLENDANLTENVENKTPWDVSIETTTQTTSKKVDPPAAALRSKTCFSCIGNLRTGDGSALKSVPIYLRANENQKGYPKFGYEFDDAICKLVSNRILCGYNKNTGTIPNSKEIVHVDADCKIRGDRIECGYGNTGSGDGAAKGRKRSLKLEMPVNDAPATTFKLKDILSSEIIKLQLPIYETATIFEFEDIFKEDTTKSKPQEEIKLVIVKEESVTKEVINSTPEPNKTIMTSTEAATPSEEPKTPVTEETSTTVITTESTLTSEITSITESTTTTESTSPTESTSSTTTETTSTTDPTTETDVSSKIPFLSLRSIMKMHEDMEKMARQGKESETTAYVPAVTRCVEIGDRIVCYDFRPKPTVASLATTSTTNLS